uniref:Uncharacterized protein n=1 Tax=Ditylenchus dipsaci TaxID=166011 RepID=A0A915ESA2_9BILA
MLHQFGTVELSISLLFLEVYYAAQITAAREKQMEQCNEVGCAGYKCFESLCNCGQQGYLLAYGDKYCYRFHEDDIFHSFDQAGQQFIHCTAQCLLDDMQDYVQTKISPQLVEQKVDCDHLKETAFESHVDCYLKCNFCTICQTNKIALWHTYDLTDFLNWLAIKKLFTTIYKCGIFQCF